MSGDLERWMQSEMDAEIAEVRQRQEQAELYERERNTPEAWEVQAEIATGRSQDEDDRQLTARVMALLTNTAPGNPIVGPGMKSIIETVDNWLDGQVAEAYKAQPLAQDWARVAKCAEEISEVMEEAERHDLSADDRARLDGCTRCIGRAVDALIKFTGQSPRKGVCGTQDDMLKELGDVVVTGMLAIQHFTRDIDLTTAVIEGALVKALNRATADTQKKTP